MDWGLEVMRLGGIWPRKVLLVLVGVVEGAKELIGLTEDDSWEDWGKFWEFRIRASVMGISVLGGFDWWLGLWM